MRRVLAALSALSFVALAVAGTPRTASAATFCGTPGTDGVVTLSSIVNTYWPGTGSPAAGATSISFGGHATGDANVGITSGDILLVIQMQGGTLNTSNSSAYGDGTGSGSGATAVTAGTYEYVVATQNRGTGAGTVNISSPLQHSYSSTGSANFQLIRVPQYISATIAAGFTALAWNGSAGGIVAIDVEGTLTAGPTLSVDGKGFRGGQGRALAGSASAAAGDYVNSNAVAAHGEKGEGTAGTPIYLYNGTTGTGSGTANGYAGGDTGRGAPGNAGGGGADADPAANDQNSGGGGGGNGGAGGAGGKTWSSNLPYGGVGGTFTPSATQVVMGGGGGAGARNNGSGYDSSGGNGGGIVMMRVGFVAGTQTITANGTSGVEPQNDGGGGGGAGGSIVVTSPNSVAGINATANGAVGTNADVLNAGNAAHGPGGGGGGGVVVESGGIGTVSVTGGAAGITDGSPTPDAHYGAAAGGTGQQLTLAAANVPGASSGAECGSITNGIQIGPAGTPDATGSYDGIVPVNNNSDFIEKAFAPNGFNAINSSTVAGSPVGNTYTSAVTGIAIRHQAHNYGTTNQKYYFYAQAPSGWTVTVNADSAGTLGAVLSGTASANTYKTAAAGIPINHATDYYVWTVYSAPAGVSAFARFDATLTISIINTNNDNNVVHDELYSGFIAQTKNYSVTSTNCGQSVPAGTWCPGAVLAYSIDVRNIAVAANGTTPASATLTASNVTVTDDGSNTNSWAKDGGYMNTPGITSTGTAPTSLTYYYNASNATTFPATYATTNKVFKFVATWAALTAGQSSQLNFSVVQF